MSKAEGKPQQWASGRKQAREAGSREKREEKSKCRLNCFKDSGQLLFGHTGRVRSQNFLTQGWGMRGEEKSREEKGKIKEIKMYQEFN